MSEATPSAPSRAPAHVVAVWGTPFVPYPRAFAAERGVEVEEVEADLASEPGGLDHPRALCLRGRPTAPRPVDHDPAYRNGLARGIPPADQDFAEITSLFEMRRVPTSERRARTPDEEERQWTSCASDIYSGGNLVHSGRRSSLLLGYADQSASGRSSWALWCRCRQQTAASSTTH
ncbi:hypothetical protein [Streptomyces carpinensis]|uniref:hypothetical protein n=1 Tax=Streptomyces carpinensis TaxID=66369 RepID=UPI00117FC480|nr:hypothetical protein [Streptomyces carpinensis]